MPPINYNFQKQTMIQILTDFNQLLLNYKAVCTIQNKENNKPFAVIKPWTDASEFIKNIKKAIENETDCESDMLDKNTDSTCKISDHGHSIELSTFMDFKSGGNWAEHFELNFARIY